MTTEDDMLECNQISDYNVSERPKIAYSTRYCRAQGFKQIFRVIAQVPMENN